MVRVSAKIHGLNSFNVIVSSVSLDDLYCTCNLFIAAVCFELDGCGGSDSGS